MKYIFFSLIILAACGDDPTVKNKTFTDTEKPIPFEMPSCDVICDISMPGLPVIMIVVPPDQVEAMEQGNPYLHCGESICK